MRAIGAGDYAMLQSYVIDVDGRFVGAAIRQADGFRFVAIDVRFDALDGTVSPSLAEVEEMARRAAAADHRDRHTLN
jgi:hypothetical protein